MVGGSDANLIKLVKSFNFLVRFLLLQIFPSCVSPLLLVRADLSEFAVVCVC